MLKKILLSIAIISGIPWAIYFGYLYYQNKLENDSSYIIRACVAKTEGPYRVPCALLSEYMGLSIDKPMNLYRYPIKAAEARLAQTHVFKSVKVKRLPPSSLLIEYELRKPVFLSATESNTAIDEEGMAFPYYPFYSPKKLPELILAGSITWGTKTDVSLPLLFLSQLKSLKLCDLSRMELDSLGEREIILKASKAYFRLKPDHLENIQYLKDFLGFKGVVDARIPNNLIVRELE